MTALVSVIIPVYNGERYLPEALDSALGQTYQNIEIIIVDDGSTDSSGIIADRHAEAHPQRVRVIHQPNSGTGVARNSAMAAARGTYIAMLDQDDVWTPVHLAEAVAVLEREPSVGLVHADIQVLHGGRRPSKSLQWRKPEDAFINLLLRRAHIACLSVVFRRSLVDVVGGFDPAFGRLGNDDRDMWLRIAKVAQLRYLDSLHGSWRRHAGNQSGDWERMRKGQLLLVERHAVGPHRHLRNRAIAAIHAETGYIQFHRSGSRREALGSYARSLCRYPFIAEAWKGAANALLGRKSRQD